jgi:hypothetical protein
MEDVDGRTVRLNARPCSQRLDQSCTCVEQRSAETIGGGFLRPCQIEWLQELWADLCTRNMHMKIDRAVSVLQVE